MQVALLEEDLAEEKLLLAVVNDADSRLVMRTAVPLASVVPGVHYSLKLVTAQGACLYITMALAQGARTELRHQRSGGGGGGSGGRSGHDVLVQARLAGCSAPLEEALRLADAESKQQQVFQQQAASSEVWAVWRGRECACQGAVLTGEQVMQLHADVDAHDEAGIGVALQAVTGSARGGAACCQAAPVQCVGADGTDALLWPPSHMMLMACAPATGAPALRLELHQRSYLPAALPAGDHGGCCTFLAQVDVPAAALQPPPKHGLHLPVVLDELPLLAPRGGGGSLTARATLEIIAWDGASYRAALKKLVGPIKRGARGAAEHSPAAPGGGGGQRSHRNARVHGVCRACAPLMAPALALNSAMHHHSHALLHACQTCAPLATGEATGAIPWQPLHVLAAAPAAQLPPLLPWWRCWWRTWWPSR